jgi:hypothetical protein
MKRPEFIMSHREFTMFHSAFMVKRPEFTMFHQAFIRKLQASLLILFCLNLGINKSRSPNRRTGFLKKIKVKIKL